MSLTVFLVFSFSAYPIEGITDRLCGVEKPGIGICDAVSTAETEGKHLFLQAYTCTHLVKTSCFGLPAFWH